MESIKLELENLEFKLIIGLIFLFNYQAPSATTTTTRHLVTIHHLLLS